MIIIAKKQLKSKISLGKINKHSYFIKNIKREKNIGKGSKFVYYGEVVKKGNKRGKEYFSTSDNLQDFKQDIKKFLKTIKK